MARRPLKLGRFSATPFPTSSVGTVFRSILGNRKICLCLHLFAKGISASKKARRVPPKMQRKETGLAAWPHRFTGPIKSKHRNMESARYRHGVGTAATGCSRPHCLDAPWIARLPLGKHRRRLGYGNNRCVEGGRSVGINRYSTPIGSVGRLSGI